MKCERERERTTCLMVPASMLMYGSILIDATLKPIALSNMPVLLAVTPLPMPDITPPDTKMYFIDASLQKMSGKGKINTDLAQLHAMILSDATKFNDRIGTRDSMTGRRRPTVNSAVVNRVLNHVKVSNRLKDVNEMWRKKRKRDGDGSEETLENDTNDYSSDTRPTFDASTTTSGPPAKRSRESVEPVTLNISLPSTNVETAKESHKEKKSHKEKTHKKKHKKKHKHKKR